MELPKTRMFGEDLHEVVDEADQRHACDDHGGGEQWAVGGFGCHASALAVFRCAAIGVVGFGGGAVAGDR